MSDQVLSITDDRQTRALLVQVLLPDLLRMSSGAELRVARLLGSAAPDLAGPDAAGTGVGT